MLLLLCSHSHYDVPLEPQRNVSMAAVRGAVRPSIRNFINDFELYIPAVASFSPAKRFFLHLLGDNFYLEI